MLPHAAAPPLSRAAHSDTYTFTQGRLLSKVVYYSTHMHAVHTCHPWLHPLMVFMACQRQRQVDNTSCIMRLPLCITACNTSYILDMSYFAAVLG